MEKFKLDRRAQIAADQFKQKIENSEKVQYVLYKNKTKLKL